MRKTKGENTRDVPWTNVLTTVRPAYKNAAPLPNIRAVQAFKAPLLLADYDGTEDTRSNDS